MIAPFFALSLALCLTWGTWLALRGGFSVPGGRGLRVIGYDPNAIGLGALAVIAAVYFYGWLYGLALCLAVAVHEYGHVLAYRICGHDDARFRLIPILGGVAISGRLPASQDKAFFIALLGPAFCLAPMGLAFALSDLLLSTSYEAAEALFVFALVLGAFNFFNLLPFWPLDGGRMLQILCQTFAPAFTHQLSIAMVVMCFILPFWGLISVAAKKTPAVFGTIAIISLSGLWIDRFVLVVPSITQAPGHLPLGILEVLITAGFFGLWGLSYLWFAERFPLVSSVLIRQHGERRRHAHQTDA